MNPYLAEFIGTMLLILLGNGVVAGAVLKNAKSENDGWLTIVVGWGLAVTLAIYAVGNFSKAHFNPAITLALTIAGEFPPEETVGYIIAQIAGAFAGAVLVWLHYLPHWSRTESASRKLAVFSTTPAIRSTPANLLSEVIATMVLVLGVQFLGANEFAAGLNPVIIGALIISIGLSLGGPTGFAINPARDLGPRIAHSILPIPGKGSSDWNYSWIPVVGPCIGGLLGAWLFKALFAN